MSSYISDRGYNSETKGVKTPNVTRSEVLARALNMIDAKISAEKANERRRSQFEKKGNGKFINDGSDDRVNGCGYNVNDLEKYPTEADRKSYNYGYTVHGGRRLMSIVEQLLKQKRYEEIDLIAERDYNNGLKEEDLGMVSNIPEYLEAYRKIANRNKRK